MGNFADKHPKFSNFLKEAGHDVGTVLNTVGDLSGMKAFNLVGGALDKVSSIGDAKREEAKKVLFDEMVENKEILLSELADIKDARSSNVSIQTGEKVPLISKITNPLLIWLVTIGFFGLITAMLFINIPESNKPIIFSMVGSLGTVWISQMTFLYGSSVGSKNKDEQIANLIGKNGN